MSVSGQYLSAQRAIQPPMQLCVPAKRNWTNECQGILSETAVFSFRPTEVMFLLSLSSCDADCKVASTLMYGGHLGHCIKVLVAISFSRQRLSVEDSQLYQPFAVEWWLRRKVHRNIEQFRLNLFLCCLRKFLGKKYSNEWMFLKLGSAHHFRIWHESLQFYIKLWSQVIT